MEEAESRGCEDAAGEVYKCKRHVNVYLWDGAREEVADHFPVVVMVDS
jgi:hypothetical protein